MDNNAYTWRFGAGYSVHVFNECRTSVVTVNYDNRLKFRLVYSVSSRDIDWNRVVACLVEAKSVLKKIKKI